MKASIEIIRALISKNYFRTTTTYIFEDSQLIDIIFFHILYYYIIFLKYSDEASSKDQSV